MEASSALQAAEEWGGLDLDEARGMTADEIHAYFSVGNIEKMFPGSGSTSLGGFSLKECAEAIIAELHDQRITAICEATGMTWTTAKRLNTDELAEIEEDIAGEL